MLLFLSRCWLTFSLSIWVLTLNITLYVSSHPNITILSQYIANNLRFLAFFSPPNTHQVTKIKRRLTGWHATRLCHQSSLCEEERRKIKIKITQHLRHKRRSEHKNGLSYSWGQHCGCVSSGGGEDSTVSINIAANEHIRSWAIFSVNSIFFFLTTLDHITEPEKTSETHLLNPCHQNASDYHKETTPTGFCSHTNNVHYEVHYEFE